MNAEIRKSFESPDCLPGGWTEHQCYRLSRLVAKQSSRLGIPDENLDLVFKDKCMTEMVSRDGMRVHYFPEGVVEHLEIPSNGADHVITALVSWVDPWGWPHREERSFNSVRFDVVDQVTYARFKRKLKAAWEAVKTKV